MLCSRYLFAINLVAIIALAGCVSQAPRESEAGVYEIGNLRVTRTRLAANAICHHTNISAGAANIQ